MCNRCGHSAKKDDFEGMDLQIYQQEGTGSIDDAFTLCDPCVAALREWLVTKPALPVGKSEKP